MNLILALMVLAGTAVLFVGPLVPGYLRWRGVRLVVCPEMRRPATVDIDLPVAVATSVFGSPIFLLQSCSHWSKRRSCARLCVQQIYDAPEDCLVRTIVARWFEDKSCVLCHVPLGPAHWYRRKPSLLAPDGRAVAWTELAPERIPDALATHHPLCRNCHVSRPPGGAAVRS